MKLDLTSLIKALAQLEKSLGYLNSDMSRADHELYLQFRAATIQAFEYTYELSWKMIKRWIAFNVGPETAEPVYSRKELFRQAAKEGLISDPVRWFQYHQARNISAHTYNEDTAAKIAAFAPELAKDVGLLIEVLDKRNA